MSVWSEHVCAHGLNLTVLCPEPASCIMTVPHILTILSNISPILSNNLLFLDILRIITIFTEDISSNILNGIQQKLILSKKNYINL